MTPMFDVESVAALMLPPGDGYLELVERVRTGGPGGPPAGIGEAARHFAQFLERVRDLDPDELAELYTVSFNADEAQALRKGAEALQRSGWEGCEFAVPVLEGLLPRLAGSRNPFAPLFTALCCVMLTQRRTLRARDHASVPESSR